MRQEPSVRQEIADRKTQLAKLAHFFSAHPDVRHSQETLAEACGADVASVRTRIGELKRGDGCPSMALQGHSGSYEGADGKRHRGKKRWEFVTRLGRDASIPALTSWTVPNAPYGPEIFELTPPEAR